MSDNLKTFMSRSLELFMSPSLKTYCNDIAISCDKIIRYTQDLDEQSFFTDELRFDAVIRHLQIISESVTQIPSGIRSQYPNIEWREWRKIAGLSDRFVHSHVSLENEIIWDIIQNKISSLKSAISIILMQEF